jgi:hypothetical protein
LFPVVPELFKVVMSPRPAVITVAVPVRMPGRVAQKFFFSVMRQLRSIVESGGSRDFDCGVAAVGRPVIAPQGSLRV